VKRFTRQHFEMRPDTPGHRQETANRRLRKCRLAFLFLHEQIDLIRPKVLVALGGTAIEGLLGKTSGITRLPWELAKLSRHSTDAHLPSSPTCCATLHPWKSAASGKDMFASDGENRNDNQRNGKRNFF